MKFFQRSFFKSKDETTEDLYEQGVRYLKMNDFRAADKTLRDAAEKGHVSALYNLFVLHGSGLISPYDFDFAAACLYAAAKARHPTASKNLFMLEGADRGGFGTNNLADLVSKAPPQAGLSAILMVCAARFFYAVSEAHGATDEVIAYELAGASYSDDRDVLQFLERTGVPDVLIRRALPKLEPGLAADQITDGLNTLSHALRTAGHDERMCRFARCSVLGYMISKSPEGQNGKPLLGLDKFFNA